MKCLADMGISPTTALDKRLGACLCLPNGNVIRTAAALGGSRPTLHDLLAKHGIER